MTAVDIPAASRRRRLHGHGGSPRKPWRAYAFHRLASVAATLLIGGSAAAQQAVPMRAMCIPSPPLLADVQSGASTMREVYVDGEGDRWFVFERVADGASMIGWINAERAVFCIVAGRAQRQTDGTPGRGA